MAVTLQIRPPKNYNYMLVIGLILVLSLGAPLLDYEIIISQFSLDTFIESATSMAAKTGNSTVKSSVPPNVPTTTTSQNDYDDGDDDDNSVSNDTPSESSSIMSAITPASALVQINIQIDDTLNPIPWNEQTRQALLEELQQNQGNPIAPRKVMLGREDDVTVEGIILPSGALVVNVDSSYAFWNDGQPKLCNLLRQMILRPTLNHDATLKSMGLPRPFLNLTMDCQAIIGGLGTGNWVTALYAVRMAVHLAKVDYQFQCSEELDKKTNILPWFESHHDAPSADNPWPYDDGPIPTESEACPWKYPGLRIDRLAKEIQSDLRRMAIALVGPPPFLKDEQQVQQSTRPLYENIVFDDVVIHFRCGDIMGGANRNDFGMIQFSEYPKWMFNSTKSVGILTQPFDKGRTRGVDRGKTEACEQATHLLVKFLQKRYPQAEFTIHNGPDETLPLAYARLVMAKQAFVSLSSFGIFPVIGTFGEGYFQRGNRGVNPFATYLKLPNLHEMTAPWRTSSQIKGMGLEKILLWFVQDDHAPLDSFRKQRVRRRLGFQNNSIAI